MIITAKSTGAFDMPLKAKKSLQTIFLSAAKQKHRTNQKGKQQENWHLMPNIQFEKQKVLISD